MVNFFVTADGSYCIRRFLETRGSEIADRFHMVFYDDLASLTDVPAGGTIFATLDKLTSTTRSAASDICAQLAAATPAVPVLNTPDRALGRYTLLRCLYEAGCNRFRVVRASDDLSTLRYPVFIRCENRHNGSRTPLLHNRHAVDRALGELAIRGLRPADLLVVEFCDTVGTDGLFRKYAALRIGDAILPRHMFTSESWMVKSRNSAFDERLVREELDYLNTHPHERWLSDVFNLAHIEYGRIDYGVYQGQPQVWEINTNPTLSRGSSAPGRQAYRALREPSRIVANRQLLQAFRKLDLPGPPRVTAITISPAVRKRLRDELQASRRKAVGWRIAGAVVASRVIRTIKPALRPAVARIVPIIGRFSRYLG